MASIAEKQRSLAEQLSAFSGNREVIPTELAQNPILPQLDFEGKSVSGYRRVRSKESNEMVLTRALRLENHLATGAALYSPAVATQIALPQGLNGGGDFVGGSSPLDVAKHLHGSPGVNARILGTMYRGLRSDVLRKTGKNIEAAFDQNMIDRLKQIEQLEAQVQQDLVAMNSVQQLAPLVKNPNGEWTQQDLKNESERLTKAFTASDNRLREVVRYYNGLIGTLSSQVYGLPMIAVP